MSSCQHLRTHDTTQDNGNGTITWRIVCSDCGAIIREAVWPK